MPIHDGCYCIIAMALLALSMLPCRFCSTANYHYEITYQYGCLCDKPWYYAHPHFSRDHHSLAPICLYVCCVYEVHNYDNYIFHCVVKISNSIRWAMSLDGQCVLNELGSGAFYQSQCGWTASSLHHRYGNEAVVLLRWHRSWSMADRTSGFER